MLGLLDHPSPKFRLIRNGAMMRIEVVAFELGKRPCHTPGAHEKMLAIASRHHGENEIADTGDRQVIGAAANLRP
ncbi:hypothetical protein HFO27_35485 [Rhizobium leguminosarum]|nr:hypothetical protein [Rhizobium leguminosarum]